MGEAHSAHGPVRFGEFEVDLRAVELRKGDIKVKLQKQPFQILEILLEHVGEVVSREELRERIWPADTFVDFHQGLSNAIKRLREALSDSAEKPRFIETIPRRGYRFIGSVDTSPAGRIDSMAVLPLENLSRDPEQEYFADGLTEALITNLAKISALRVVSRTSAMQYKGVHKAVREIGRDLGVTGIVEGTVLRSGSRVRISVQLIDASSDIHLWAESYDRGLRDILGLQSEVACAIAEEIRAKLKPNEHDQLARVRPVNPDAYEAYLKGRFYWNKRTPAAVKKGAEYFQQAVEKDPSYAAAYAGLADSAIVAGWWGFIPPDQGCGRAKAAARKALEIEETAEAHASLGFALLHYDFDYLTAEKELQRAIGLNPRYATAHQWYGHCLSYIGRFEEAVVETSLALKLDPISLILHTSHAGIFWISRQWDRAIEVCRAGFELDPNSVPLSYCLAHAYQGKGAYDDAICERQRTVDLSGGAPFFIAELGSTHAAAGARIEAIQILERLNDLSKQHYVSAHSLALIHTGLRQMDEAFDCLENAYEERSAALAWVKADPRLDNLRSDPRFQDLLSRMSFPE